MTLMIGFLQFTEKFHRGCDSKEIETESRSQTMGRHSEVESSNPSKPYGDAVMVSFWEIFPSSSVFSFPSSSGI